MTNKYDPGLGIAELCDRLDKSINWAGEYAPRVQNTDLRQLIDTNRDLLAACKALLVVVDRLPNGHSAERVVSARIARAAIASAEGDISRQPGKEAAQ